MPPPPPPPIHHHHNGQPQQQNLPPPPPLPASSSATFFYPAQPSPPGTQPNDWKPREGESIFKTAVFLGSMIVVAVLLLVLICMARWDNIVSLIPVFDSAAAGRRWRWRGNGTNSSRQHHRQSSRRRHHHDPESSPEDQPSPVLSTTLGKKNRGTNKRVVESLPVINYASASASVSGGSSLDLGCLLLGNECTICLCEFVDGDRVRVLPECCHGFHVDCVDVWLIAHGSCPSCRNSLHRNAGDVLKKQLQQRQAASTSSAAVSTTLFSSSISFDGSTSDT